MERSIDSDTVSEGRLHQTRLYGVIAETLVIWEPYCSTLSLRVGLLSNTDICSFEAYSTIEGRRINIAVDMEYY